MSYYTGEDLLNVFEDLNIQLLNLNPNVVKAWFDTDCEDMKNVLNWMCSSISASNFVSPLEYSEFCKLESPLVEQRYEQEVNKLESEFPGIFDMNLNIIEAEFMQDEIEILLEEEQEVEDLITMNESLQKELTKELIETSSLEIKTSVNCKKSQENCFVLSKTLDGLNKKLLFQLAKYGSNLNEFEFSTVPKFISNMNFKCCQENFDDLLTFITPTLGSIESFTENMENKTSLDFTCANDSLANSLSSIRKRILYSHQKQMVNKIEIEKLMEILSFCNKSNVESVMKSKDSYYIQLNMQSKEESKKRMCAMLDNISSKHADYHISQIKMGYAQQELQTVQSNLNILNNIINFVLKFFSQYLLISLLYLEENKDIVESEKFFKKVLKYITEDLQNCMFRTEKMNIIIGEYEIYSLKPVNEKMKLIKSIVKILSEDEDFTLARAFTTVGDVKSQLDILEIQLFHEDFNDHRKMTKTIIENINILQKFLVCGPTHRVILIPSELHFILSKIEERIKEEMHSINSAVDISISMKTRLNKWQNYKRLLWIHFLTDPSKMFSILEEAEEEFSKTLTNSKNLNV